MNPHQIRIQVSPNTDQPAYGAVDIVIGGRTLVSLHHYPVQQLADCIANRTENLMSDPPRENGHRSIHSADRISRGPSGAAFSNRLRIPALHS